MRQAFALALLAAAAAGCAADLEYRRAALLERAGRRSAAVGAWTRFAGRHPADARTAEALVRAARLYVLSFRRCAEARPLLERAVREHPGREPWATRARQGLLDCPEYFPLRDGSRWTYVDSQTLGRNMRLEIEVSASTDGARGTVRGAYYAGAARFRDYRRSYAKEDWAVWEIEGKDRVPILRYPYSPQMIWRARRGGRPVEWTIVSDKERVRLAGGVEYGCLKVKEAEPGAQAWRYDYYAPGLGRVKTTIGVPGAENPNTELQSMTVAPPS